jgi:hypothetical protein
MSVFVTLRVAGDAAKLQETMKQHPDRWQAINARAKEHGAIHHRFLVSADGGEIAVADEWETAEGFQRFFAASPEIPELMAAAGVTSEPQITFWHALDTPDAF